MNLVVTQTMHSTDTTFSSSAHDTLDGFTAVYREHHKMIRAILFNLCGARDLDDLVQEAFLRIWKGLPKFKHGSKLKTWLYRVTVNTALDHFRKNKKSKQEVYLKEDIQGTESKESRLLNQDLVQKGLERLSEIHRTVLVLANMEELAIREIAAIIRVSEGTVKSRLHYAKRHFLEFLENEGVRL